MEMTLDYIVKDNEDRKTENEILQDGVIKLKTCDVCYKRVNCKYDNKTYIQPKHQIQEYKCDQWENFYKNKSSINMHIQAIHSKIIFQWDVSDNKFETADCLTMHMTKMQLK